MTAEQNNPEDHSIFPGLHALAPGSLPIPVLLLSLLLGGCASAPQRSEAISGIPINAQSGCHAPTPNLRAAYNRAYSVKGRTYVPLRTADGYEQVGMASWYGWESGSTTSMGTRFSPREFSAASRVLPLPTCVQVTNLDNGLSALVLVNDRGPFVSGRILDLSMGAAKALGVTRSGTAQVRIVALPDGANPPLQIARVNQSQGVTGADGQMEPATMPQPVQGQAAFLPEQFAPNSTLEPTAQAGVPGRGTPNNTDSIQATAAQPAPMEVQTLPPMTTPAPTSAAVTPSQIASGPQTPMPQPALTLASPQPLAASPPVSGTQMQAPAANAMAQTYVQTGAFTLEANAQAERARMQAAGIQDVLIVPGYIRGQTFYRVQVGPLLAESPDMALVQKLHGLGLTRYSVVQQ